MSTEPNITINLEELRTKLYLKLRNSGWGNKLKTFLLSEDLDKIILELYKQSQAGEKFTPVLKQIFRAFEECPYGELKIVICSMDPYPRQNAADGIAFSCSNLNKPEASLRYIFGEIERTIYPEGGYVWDVDLKRWSNQGILMLNSALTTSVGQIGSHFEIWRPFMTFLFDILKTYNPGLIYVFLGGKARELSNLVSDKDHKLYASHPASAAYKHKQHWDSGNLFQKINELSEKYYKSKIIW